ncbi:MAG: hypothetical protein RSB77_05060 [Bacilli bacterium]
MNENDLGNQITDDLINEDFPSREMKIEHLKNISNSIKNDPELKEELKNELGNNPNNETKEQKLAKTKNLLLSRMLNKKFNGFASLMVLSLITFLCSGGTLLYILITNGFFN